MVFDAPGTASKSAIAWVPPPVTTITIIVGLAWIAVISADIEKSKGERQEKKSKIKRQRAKQKENQQAKGKGQKAKVRNKKFTLLYLLPLRPLLTGSRVAALPRQ